MKSLCLLFLAFIAIISTSCEKVYGDGPTVTQTRPETNFNGIDLRCSADVWVKQGNDYKVEVSAQQNILNILLTYTTNNRLVIRFKDDVKVRSHDPVRIDITVPMLTDLRVSGSGNIHTSGILTPSRMDMNISGSGNITVSQLITDFIDAQISGSGNLAVVSGTAQEIRSRISGSGNIDLLNVPATIATTTTSGSGDTQLNVSQRLDVTISGSGTVYYRGQPQIKTQISGSGKVLPR